MDLKEILSADVTLFPIIDVLGSIPYILVIRKKEGVIYPGKATLTATALMFFFLFTGEWLLNLFGVSIHAFALAGAVIILASSIELIFGVSLFKEDHSVKGIGSIMPIAFPLLAGAGTFTTIISLKSYYYPINVSAAIIINSVIIFMVLRSVGFLDRNLSPASFAIIRKSFAIIVMAISIQMLYTHIIHVISSIGEVM